MLCYYMCHSFLPNEKTLISHSSAVAFIPIPEGEKIKNQTIRLLFTTTAELSWRTWQASATVCFTKGVLSKRHRTALTLRTMAFNPFIQWKKNPRQSGHPRTIQLASGIAADPEANLGPPSQCSLCHYPVSPRKSPWTSQVHPELELQSICVYFSSMEKRGCHDSWLSNMNLHKNLHSLVD